MDHGHLSIVKSAADLAMQVPPQTVELLAGVLEGAHEPSASSLRSRIGQCISQPHYRNLAVCFFDEWQTTAPNVPAASVAIALRTAAYMHRRDEESQVVELVWTGPDAEAVPCRRTEQAILQVLDSAARRIILVSYAVYRIPRICAALVRAAQRGVRITVVVETPNKIDGQTEYDTIQALGEQVKAAAALFYGPAEKRSTENGGKPGILHVKCAVADGRWLFLSSANLTEYAFTVNMELGLLVTGGPCQVEKQFDRLIATGVLARVG